VLDPTHTALLVVTSPGDPASSVGVATSTGHRLLAELAAAAVSLGRAGVAVVEIQTGPPPARRPQPDSGRPAGGWPTDTIVRPLGWDGFHGTPLDAVLRAAPRDTLILAGWWLEVGVHSTMRSANDRGYECLLATDLVAGLSESTTVGAISSIQMSGGIFGATGLSRDAVVALTNAAAGRTSCHQPDPDTTEELAT
jgi:nicotinamidase-related amidase